MSFGGGFLFIYLFIYVFKRIPMKDQNMGILCFWRKNKNIFSLPTLFLFFPAFGLYSLSLSLSDILQQKFIFNRVGKDWLCWWDSSTPQSLSIEIN